MVYFEVKAQQEAMAGMFMQGCFALTNFRSLHQETKTAAWRNLKHDNQ